MNNDINKWVSDATPHQIREFFNGVSFLKAVDIMDELESKISENSIIKVITALEPTLVENTIIIKKGIDLIDEEVKDLEEYIRILNEQNSPPTNINIWNIQLQRAKHKRIIYQKSLDMYIRTVFSDVSLE